MQLTAHGARSAAADLLDRLSSDDRRAVTVAADLPGSGSRVRRQTIGAALALLVLTLFFNLRYLAVPPTLTEE